MALVRHIVVLKCKGNPDAARRRADLDRVKATLDPLKGIIPGIVDFDVVVDALPTSNMDMVINSSFVSEEALAAYQIHPEHVKASEFVATLMEGRTCIDYYE